MEDELINQLSVVVLLSLDRVDVERRDQIAILEKALERRRIEEQVDESALLQVFTGIN